MNEMATSLGKNRDGHQFSSVILLFFLVFLCRDSLADSASNFTTTVRKVSSFRMARIHRHLNKINKPAVLTIQSPDGDIIDCVHKRHQPALDHPLLKNHKIQKIRPEFPKTKKTVKVDGMTAAAAASEKNVNSSSDSENSRAWQMWHHSGQRCPEGTIPIRRSTANDVLRAKSLYDFGRKSRSHRISTERQKDAPDIVSGNGHEHAIAYTGTSEEIYGAKATINVWEPEVGVVDEFSLSQIWVLSGTFDGSDLNSIEAGWQVSPMLYGDLKARLFTYWTSDAYQATGCYNLLCSGFVQTNNRIAIGAAISPISVQNGDQYDITILIWKDPKLGNWWMGFGDNTLVGYWPAALFTHLADKATMVEWGGEVVNSRVSGKHTTTQMGSGQFADQGFGKASYFRNLEIVDSDNSLTTAQQLSTLAENSNCYNIKSSNNNEWGTHFYFGGPGRSDLCP